MPLPNIAELVTDPELTQAFTVIERTQTFTPGRAPIFADATSTPRLGVVVPAKASQLAALPEGTRLSDVLRVFSPHTVRTGDGVNIVSDVISFAGARWLVYSSINWGGYGFFEILAVKNDNV